MCRNPGGEGRKGAEQRNAFLPGYAALVSPGETSGIKNTTVLLFFFLRLQRYEPLGNMHFVVCIIFRMFVSLYRNK